MSRLSAKVFGVYMHRRPDGSIFYIGKGTRQRSRELSRPYNPLYTNIVNKLGKSNVLITFIVCENEQHALAEEIRLIAYYRSQGVKLANRTDGGEGISGYRHSPEAKENIGAFWRGKKRPPEHSAACKAAQGTPESRESKRISSKAIMADPEMRRRVGLATKAALSRPEVKVKLGKQNKGKTFSPEHRRKIREAINRPEVRAKINAALRGKKRTLETCMNISRSLKGKKFSEERKAKLREAHLGKKLSPEHAAAIRAGHARRKARLLSTQTTESDHEAQTT